MHGPPPSFDRRRHRVTWDYLTILSLQVAVPAQLGRVLASPTLGWCTDEMLLRLDTHRLQDAL